MNFPPTEFLQLDYFDVCAFNVYLHEVSAQRDYLVRRQHVAGHRPLLLSEAGADSLREGLDEQAETTVMQLRCAFEEGACGAIVYAWTDEWWRGGNVINDWAFGLVDASRRPKPALAAVTRVFDEAPFPAADAADWPQVSVVVCAYNAAETIDECLTSLETLTYPRTQLIVINDGSQDETAEIARRHPEVEVIALLNGGLSAARNAGLAAATGEIVASVDLPTGAIGTPMTYMVEARPHIALTIGGGPRLVAFALP